MKANHATSARINEFLHPTNKCISSITVKSCHQENLIAFLEGKSFQLCWR